MGLVKSTRLQLFATFLAVGMISLSAARLIVADDPRVGFSYYAKAISISPQFYQKLLDRGWRRSGTLLYRPDQRRSCCPHYTIRVDASAFKPSRSQRQTANRFNNFVVGELFLKETARLHPRSKEQTKLRKNEYQFMERIHEAQINNLTVPPIPAHKFEVTLEPDSFTEEKWTVFGNYQECIHKEPAHQRSRQSFKNFLCDSPLRAQTVQDSTSHKPQYGSFHQCYRLDGQLVAVGVLDLLPHCVSSVYFFYHESIHKFVPGKLGALHEIALALEEDYRWWYPGFYIHSCPKMRYKIDYAPVYMLDPSSLQWDTITPSLLELLDRRPFVSLSLQSHSGSMGDDGPPTESGQDARLFLETQAAKTDHEPETVFSVGMVGVTSASVMASVDLGDVALRVSRKSAAHRVSEMRGWANSDMLSWPKIVITELIAAIGPDLRDRVCIDLT